MRERWKQIAGFEGYEVSTRGRVRSYKRRRPVILKAAEHRSGHQYVTLVKEGRAQHAPIHRLVYGAFVGELQPGTDIHHRDGNPANNEPSNLEAVAHGAHMSRHVADREKGTVDDRSRAVAQYTKAGDLVDVYPSMTRAAEETGSQISGVSNVCLGKRKSHNGFIWKLVEG